MPVMPAPLAESDVARWSVTARRHRMLTGDWTDDADERLGDFFVPEAAEYLPSTEISRCIFASVTDQIAVVYDSEPDVDIAGDDTESDDDDTARASIVTEELWPNQQELCRFVVGLNDCGLRVDLEDAPEGGKRAVYRVVTPDVLVCVGDPKRPDRPVCVEELRERVHPTTGESGWFWERWDVRDPRVPEFKVFRRGDHGAEFDFTEEYTGGTGWPDDFRDTAGAPVLPYILYHRFPGRRMWSPTRGAELVSGTLTSAALWTMWVGGVRDGAHPARGVIDGVVQGTTVTPDARSPGEALRMNPLALTQIHSRSDQFRASTFQWQPAMDPKTGAESLETFDAGLAQFAGVAPGDIHRGSASASGYSIVISRQGQRKAQAKLIPSFRMSDRRTLATAARLVNRANGSTLPETEIGYAIEYANLGQSPEEYDALVKSTKDELAAGLISKRTAIKRLHPTWTDERVNEEIAEISGTAQPDPVDDTPTPTTSTP